jgi:hypothetical protein
MKLVKRGVALSLWQTVAGTEHRIVSVGRCGQHYLVDTVRQSLGNHTSIGKGDEVAFTSLSATARLEQEERPEPYLKVEVTYILISHSIRFTKL